MDNRSPRSSREIMSPSHKDSHKITKKPPQPQLQPQLQQREPSQPQPPRIIYTVPPRIFHTHPNNFMTLVQRLTGQTSTSITSSSTSATMDASRGLISPAARYAAMANANASNERFVGGIVDTTNQYHLNGATERPSFYHSGILSPGPTSQPSISPDFFSTVGANDPQGLSSFFNEFNSILQNIPSTISPAARYAAMANANASNESFMGGVDTTNQYYHHQNGAIERPSFYPSGVSSSGPTSQPSISPDFFSTFGPTDPQDFLFPSPSMADGYWNQQRQHQPSMSSILHGGPPKRPRSDFDHDMHSYLSREEDRGIPHSVKDTRTIGSAYDRYLQNVQTPSEEVGRFNGVGMGRPGGNSVMPSPSLNELMNGRGGILHSDFGPNGRAMGFGQQDLVGRPSRELLRLPPDASNTLYVEGLPSNCSRREVAHIFRPFLGYKEVRLVTKDSKQRNGDPIVLCFVDFENSACAATARTALQGYRMDEDEPDSKILQIQFSRNPGPRPGQRGGRR